MGRITALLGVAAALIAAIVTQPSAESAPLTHDCGLPDTPPLWIEFGAGSVPPEVRSVFSRPGVVVAASGTALPAQYRAKGVATAYFVLNLPRYAGQPGEPHDPATVQQGADQLFEQAVASTACQTPLIALNELLGSHLPTPWSATNAQYRADVLALVERLAQRGARPALLVHGNPSVTGDATGWWLAVARSADIVYEAYYDARNISRLGPILGSRRVRLGMRGVVRLFAGIGVPRERLGFMLGFQVAPGAAGREGLQPREEWFRIVKWQTLGARRVALDEGTTTIWSWGWGTFGPQSIDPDKPAAACVYLWARDPSLCSAPTAAGPAFNASLTEGQIALPPGIQCTFEGGAVTTAAFEALSRFTRNPQGALNALFGRAALRPRVPIPQREILRVEEEVIGRVFGGSRRAYVRALERRRASVAIARGVISDELRRRQIATMLGSEAPGQTVLTWTADIEAAAVDTATCLRDALPGTGDFPRTDRREVGTVPLPSYLPFLFADRDAPVAPAGLTATPGPASITLDWHDSSEPDAVGYHVYRAAAVEGPYVRLTNTRLTRSTYADPTAPAGVPSFYVVRAVDTSRNRSEPSAAASTSPA